MRESLELVIIAITLLVAALVILTIFGTGLTPIGNLTSFQNSCRTSGKVACEGVGTEPITWQQQVTIGGQATSCKTALGDFGTCCTGGTGNPPSARKWGC